MKSSAYFCVMVIDHITKETVVIADFVTRSEASELARVIAKYSACEIVVTGSEFMKE